MRIDPRLRLQWHLKIARVEDDASLRQVTGGGPGTFAIRGSMPFTRKGLRLLLRDARSLRWTARMMSRPPRN